MNDNVKIPLTLLNQAIYVLESVEIFNYSDSFLAEYYDLLGSLRKKKDSLELREAYARIIHAKDEDSRHFARMRYLEQRRSVRGDF